MGWNELVGNTVDHCGFCDHEHDAQLNCVFPPQKLASVDPIKEECEWSSKAAAGDALSRVPEDAPFVALWLEGDVIKWSTAHLNVERLAVLAAVLDEFLSKRIRDLVTR